MNDGTLGRILRAISAWLYNLRSLKNACLLLLAVSGVPTAAAQSSADLDWPGAAERVVRLKPNQFPFLPKIAAAKLEQLGCRIPQHWFSSERNNLIVGQFLKPEQFDIALLCEKESETNLMILPNMGKGAPVILVKSTVQNYLQHVGENQIGFSWGISKINMRKVDLKAGGFRCKWRPEHSPDGIDDAFIEKASTIHFRAKRSWQECYGSD